MYLVSKSFVFYLNKLMEGTNNAALFSFLININNLLFFKNKFFENDNDFLMSFYYYLKYHLLFYAPFESF